VQHLDLVGYTADLASLVLTAPATGERFRVAVDPLLVATVVEVLEQTDDHPRLELLGDLARRSEPERAAAADGPSPAAALLTLGRVATGQPRPQADGAGSRLTPSEMQRMLRAGKSPESVAEQAGVDLEWVLRWYQPIAAEQRNVITSVRGGRQERPGLGLSDDLIGDAVRINLLARDVEADSSAVQWSAARPEGRPYWTVTLRYGEGERIRRATWRYDIGTGRVTPRDDLAADLGWTMPVTHPAPGRLHLGHQEVEDDGPPPQRAGPPPPPARQPVRWDPPAPPAGPRRG
jgi:hypothetical protein